MEKMYETRLKKVAGNLRAARLAQTLVTAPASVFYLTGCRVSPGERMLALLVRDDGSCVLYANRLFALTGVAKVPLVEYDDTDDCVAILASDLQPGEIGIDKTWQSQFTIRLMGTGRDLRPVLGSQCVDDARMVKGPDELEWMRVSSRLNDQAIARTIESLREGMTEREVCALYEQNAKAAGGTTMSFPPLICFGANCAEPHHESDDTVLKRGDTVILDVGLMYRDYCSDMTRTVFFGEAGEEQRKVYEVVLAANEAGRRAVRPGVPMKEFDRAAREVIEEAGYGPYFTHRTGHGIGLEVHEFPDNSAVSETVARPGMVFSVEPGVYLPGRFGVRVEDLIAVTEEGGETLNHLSREFRVVG